MIIRAMDQDEDVAHWLQELLDIEASAAGLPAPADDCYLVLSNEIGDWIGGLRYSRSAGAGHT